MRLILAALLILGSVGSAFAQPAEPEAPVRAPRATLQQRFDAANVTHDGKLTLEQANAAGMRRIVERFDTIDVKRHGFVTLDDIHVDARAQRAAKHMVVGTSRSGPAPD